MRFDRPWRWACDALECNFHLFYDLCMIHLINKAWILLAFPGLLLAQFEPQSAYVHPYFPHLADGGDSAQSWQTSLIFHNPNPLGRASTCIVNFYGDDGSPLRLDFGSGPSERLVFTIPSQGRQSFRSRAPSPSIVTGSAVANCSLPVQATVLFRAIQNGVPQIEISAPGATASAAYRSAANSKLGVAVANTFSSAALHVTLYAYDSKGVLVGEKAVDVAPHGHRSFNLSDLMTSLPSAFEGTLLISSGDSTTVFGAWTLNVEDGLLSTLPDGSLAWPISHHDRILQAYRKLLDAAQQLFPSVDLSATQLTISGDPVINAFARRDGVVQINLALSQLISDSPSELAFIVAHELAHIVQFKSGQLYLYPTNSELDADTLGMMFCLLAGYDPYAGSGAFGKLMMASQRTGLLAQAFDDLYDPHTSFSNRMGKMFDSLMIACADPAVASFCSQYKSLIHPNFPPGLPLVVAPRPRVK
jgi:hypothetical protein